MDRLTRLGISDMSDRELSKVLGIARETWDAIQEGANVRPTSYLKAETALATYVEEMGLEEDDTPPAERVSESFIEYQVTGDFGVTIAVKGPVTDRAELEDSVVRIVRELRAGRQDD